jgi:hypothetical protein
VGRSSVQAVPPEPVLVNLLRRQGIVLNLDESIPGLLKRLHIQALVWFGLRSVGIRQ